MSLKDKIFSDLIILPSGRAFLKGTPEMGANLMELSSTDFEVTKELISTLFERNDGRSRQTIEGITYRCAIYEDIHQGYVAFLRRLPETIRPFDHLGLPIPLAKWLLAKEQQKGLILFAGPQASGKTTSAASFIDERLRLYGGHMVSFESPAEMPLSGKVGEFGYRFQGDIKESELGEWIKKSHRYASPDILYIGEILDPYAAAQTIRVALGSSQQLVVSTIHGLHVSGALDRLLTWAKDMDGDSVFLNLSHCLLAVIFQEIHHTANGPVLEVPQFLLVPFTEKSKGLRARIKEGKLSFDGDMCEQRNILINGGSI